MVTMLNLVLIPADKLLRFISKVDMKCYRDSGETPNLYYLLSQHINPIIEAFREYSEMLLPGGDMVYLVDLCMLSCMLFRCPRSRLPIPQRTLQTGKSDTLSCSCATERRSSLNSDLTLVQCPPWSGQFSSGPLFVQETDGEADPLLHALQVPA